MYIHDDFLLQSDLAKTLYKAVKDLPIIDYHNHLSPREMYHNERFHDITELWLKHDHYKWRLMRASGIDERFITGDTSNKDKFLMYAKALEHAYMNPLHHWSHMELKEYFNITEVLTTENAERIYEQANRYLEEHPTTPRSLLSQKKVEVLCTTDDLNDELEYHRLLAEEEQSFQVLPTFRPDVLFRFQDDSFFDVIARLENNTKITISGITSLVQALSQRLDYFQSMGCTIADHGFTTLRYHHVSKDEASSILKKRLMKYDLTQLEQDQLTIYLLRFFLIEYSRRNMVGQLHLGALRNTNEKMFQSLGRDTGFDSLSDDDYIKDLNQLFSDIERYHELPKLIVYNLHPKDNEALASLCGNFTKDVPGKVQLGAAWWFNDNMRGIQNQLKTYAEYLNLNTAVGMLTDSRSLLSFVRHDYYRRLLAQFLASNVEQGLIPKDRQVLFQLMKNISYFNSKTFFSFSI